MKIWVDAQLSPHLAPWLNERFGVEAYSVRWLGYRDASDEAIFAAERESDAVVMTKDRDFLNLLDINGPPPRVSNVGVPESFWPAYLPSVFSPSRPS